MSGRFFLSGTVPLFEGERQPLSTLTFSLTGTATPQDTYSDAGLASANANPVVSDAEGYFGEIFIKRERYKVIWKNAAGTTLKTWDPVDKDQVFTRGAGLPSDPHPGQKHANTSDGHTHEYKLATAAWLDLGATDAIANTATVTEQLTGTSTSVYSTPDSVAALWQRGTDIPSDTTLSLPSTGGSVFNVTLTNPISGIGSAQGGRTVKLKFAGALTLTHNGTTFILPGAANITTVAGDTAEFINEAAADGSGSNWRCFSYERSSGSPLNIADLDAVQADQETGTSITKIVTPGVQHYHQSAAKAWGYSILAAGVPASPPTVSYNITSMADTNTGRTVVTIATDFSSADWACIAMPISNIPTVNQFCGIRTATIAAGSTEIDNMEATSGLQDPIAYNFVMFGDQ